MPFLRNAVVIGGGVAVTAWLITAAQAPAPAAPPVEVRPAALAPPGPSHAERLRERLARMPDTRSGPRDPFRFSIARRPGRTLDDPAAGRETTAAAAPVALPAPDLRLLGIAEDTVDGEARRTAIISGMNQLFLVKDGESLALRYQVTKVDAEAVEIQDLAENRTLRLALH